MNQHILRKLSLVAAAALVASGAAMAQSSSAGNGSSSNATGAVNGSSGTSGMQSTSPSLPGNQNASPNSPPVDYNKVDPSAAGNVDPSITPNTSATSTKHDKSRHSGKKAKRSQDAASAPQGVLDDPSKAGGGSGNSNVR